MSGSCGEKFVVAKKITTQFPQPWAIFFSDIKETLASKPLLISLLDDLRKYSSLRGDLRTTSRRLAAQVCWRGGITKPKRRNDDLIQFKPAQPGSNWISEIDQSPRTPSRPASAGNLATAFHSISAQTAVPYAIHFLEVNMNKLSRKGTATGKQHMKTDIA